MGKFPFLFSFLLFSLIVSGKHGTQRNVGSKMIGGGKGRIGAIVDCSSRIGKEQSLAMRMAVESFNSNDQNFSLVIRDSESDPYQAALAAEDLISRQRVQVLIGPQTWEAVFVVAKVGNKNQIPILALANDMPKWATERLDFLIQASPSQLNQMKAIASIIGSWDWHLVNVIYEEGDFSTVDIFPYLEHALKDVGAEISEFVGLPHFDSNLLSTELERLRQGPSRVFVVHMSFKLALHLLQTAKDMEMMGNGYVWISTDSFTSLAHSLNASTSSSLQGVIGVKSYFPEINPLFLNFYIQFCRRFRLEHSDEYNHEPSIFAVQAYEATRTAAMAMSETRETGHHLLESIELTDFQGLGGKVQFKDRKLAPADTFQIVNIVGRSYRDLGFWSDELGFSRALGGNSSANLSMKDLGQVFWPGGSTDTPRGWAVPTDANELRIGVPTSPMFKQYVNVEGDQTGNNLSFNGLAIDLFKATLDHLHFPLPHKFFAYNGTYDDLVKKIYLKEFDAAVGDIAIVSTRYEHAEFTHPYTEAGLVMIVPTTKNRKRNHGPEPEGSMFNHAGTILCSSFTTLFSLHGNRLHSNLSRMTMMVWLFVALVITQIYTANLTSMLTIQKLEPTISDIETLHRMNAFVGYGRGSFVKGYLEQVLHFPTETIKNYSTPEGLADALRNQEIAATFLEVPFAKLFLARYCQEFKIAGPTYKVGGFGFAFPRGSLLLPYIDEALLKVSETGKYRELEDSMIANVKCEEGEGKDRITSLSPNSFFFLFLLSAGVSTIALALYSFNARNSNLQRNTVWRLMVAVVRHWGSNRTRFLRPRRDEPRTILNNMGIQV
ncbi:glutamate receptor 2.8-like isoform X2 [Cucurbita pepo subsp. pepo]|uniref:glutamate receptor 2.8-like isoform X2 n=1 Tax=Cucurbita pepo subsp. pepo TaxID=3664 RepID=UPI000C9D36D4|nr:glutamate receptor 2.8-like isoform X2 [Cucurbita pepo subsp. pepo]